MIEVTPAHDFEGIHTMLGPKKPESSVCWCLSWRLSSKENRELVGVQRAEKVRALTRRTIAPASTPSGIAISRVDAVSSCA